MTTKKAKPNVEDIIAMAKSGEDHRPRHSTRAKEAKEKTSGTIIVGRPKAFDEATERLNLMLPAEMVQWIKHKAITDRTTPGIVVSDIIRPAMKK